MPYLRCLSPSVMMSVTVCALPVGGGRKLSVTVCDSVSRRGEMLPVMLYVQGGGVLTLNFNTPFSSCFTKYGRIYIQYILYLYTVQVLRVFLNISPSKLNMSSTLTRAGNLWVPRNMSSFTFIKTSEYP